MRTRFLLSSIFSFLFSLFSFPAIAQSTPAALPSNLKTEGAVEQRVVAYIYGNVPVTRQEFVEFLIARGGADKLDILVNKRIVETAAAQRKITVTEREIEAAVEDDLKGVGKKDVIYTILRRYGKTLFEWKEDVVKPRLLLGKMVRDRVQVTEADVRQAYEAQYGEKRQGKVIIWPKPDNAAQGDGRPSAQLVDAVRGSDAEFDKVAVNQADVNLAKSGGQIAPVGRAVEAGDPAAINTLFALAPGQTSGLVDAKTGWMVIKCTGLVPPDAKHPLEKALYTELEREVMEFKTGRAIPTLFDELRAQAKPNLIARANAGVQQASVNPAAPSLPPGPPEQVLAVVFDSIRITREELGEFLIARGGTEKLEYLVNKRIVEAEAARRNITAAPEEVETLFQSYIKAIGPNVTKEDFIKQVLPQQKKTLHEYLEDVVKPEIVLSKMVRDRVQVTEDDLRRAHERKYGEKRACQIIMWRKGEEKAAIQQWDKIRTSPAGFDRAARTQSDPNLAAGAGRVLPIGRHLEAEDPTVENVAFSLAAGEISHLLQTRTGTMCLKCNAILPPDASQPLERVRAQLEKEEFEKKVNKEIPKFFAELKEQAKPTLLLKGAPTQQEFEQGVREAIHEMRTGANGSGVAAPPK